MKQLILTLMVALMSVMASTPAAAKSSKGRSIKTVVEKGTDSVYFVVLTNVLIIR